jgi:hypothetical protein
VDTIGVQFTQLLIVAVALAAAAGVVLFRRFIAVRLGQSSRLGAWVRPIASGDWLNPPEEAVPVLVPVRASGLSRAPPIDSSLKKEWPGVRG